MELKDLRPKQKRKRKPKRLGRGRGSGKGKTSGRGQGGEKSRSGPLFYSGFEGGNVPYFRKIPKRGFHHTPRIEYQCVNVQDLNSVFKKNEEVNSDNMLMRNLIADKYRPVKVLGKGKIEIPLSVKARKFSGKAKEKIEKAGGKAESV